MEAQIKDGGRKVTWELKGPGENQPEERVMTEDLCTAGLLVHREALQCQPMMNSAVAFWCLGVGSAHSRCQPPPSGTVEDPAL